jgi:hypothetical protein
MQMLIIQRYANLQELSALKRRNSGAFNRQGKKAIVPNMLPRDATLDPLQRHIEPVQSN